MSKTAKPKKKSKYCACKGVNKTTCKMMTGYKPKKGGGCPVKAKAPKTSTKSLKKTSAPKSSRAKRGKYVDPMAAGWDAYLANEPARRVASAYHSGSRAHDTSRDAYFTQQRNARNAAAMKKAMKKLKKNPNAGAQANAYMADLFPGMSGLRGFRTARLGRKQRRNRRRSR